MLINFNILTVIIVFWSSEHEGLLAHQNHLMMEMKRLWTHLEVKTKDIDLYNEMTLSYEQDIKVSWRYL